VNECRSIQVKLPMTWPALAGGLVGLGAAAGGCLYYACSVPTSQVLGPALVRGPSDQRRVSLTFDDGPAPPFTTQVLDTLREYRVTATFFVCGKNVERFPAVLERIHGENHGIGNHTYSHPLLYCKSRREMAEEIDKTQSVIECITGRRPRLFRPPCGIRWFGLFPLLRERGMRLIQWSDAGFDWKKENRADDIVKLVLAHLDAGSVILLHDGRNALPPDQFDRSRTVAALPRIIESVRSSGLEFVPVEEFLKEQESGVRSQESEDRRQEPEDRTTFQ